MVELKEEKQTVRSSLVKAALVVALGLLVGVGCNVTRTAFEVPKAVMPDFDTASNYQVKKGAQAAQYKFTSVAVLPFGRPRSLDMDDSVRFHINRLHEFFDGRLRQYGHYRVVPLAEVERAMTKHAMRYVRRGEQEVATLIGKDLGVDTVLVGDVTRWREREGSALGAKKPASVAFQAFLFRVDNGAMLWKTSFSKTQKPLSENVLEVENFLKGGATWQSSDTLARLGVEEVLRTFPGHQTLHPRNIKF
ncbi:MAG: hypothetical protein RX318_07735 [bacterium]|nr:hypothetical protein [bacterium]